MEIPRRREEGTEGLGQAEGIRGEGVKKRGCMSLRGSGNAKD
jgi:hypothetical protein